MRDIEFLPSWYVKTRTRRKLLKVQVVLTSAIALCLGGWTVTNIRHVSAQEIQLATRKAALVESEKRVQERQQLERLSEKLQTQKRVDASLGLNVESARVLAMIDKCLPVRSALVSVECRTEEQVVQPSAAALATGTPPPRQTTRLLTVSVKGVSPSRDDVAEFYEALSNTPVCRDVRLDYCQERVDSNRVMQEFLLMFNIPLDAEKAAQ